MKVNWNSIKVIFSDAYIWDRQVCLEDFKQMYSHKIHELLN